MRLPIIAVLASSLASSTLARADPLFDHGQDHIEDQYADGDLDEEDLIAMRLGAHTPSADMHGGSWVSLMGFTRLLRSGRNDLGAIVVVGLALDRIATGPVHHADEIPKASPSPPPAPPPQPPPPAPPAQPRVDPIPPRLARDCVAAALRTAGIGVDDRSLDALVSRARASAWLPETRMRAMRLWADANHVTTAATTDTASFYDSIGANFVLELRLTWRFERLLYSGDEPTIERVRLERQDARSRVATHVLEVLFAWQRARVAENDAPPSSRELEEAQLREAEEVATLDVLTGGWFSARTAPPSTPQQDPP
jgi:hypothetical protein